LFRRLFRRYNQFIRPVENVSDPVTVEFEVSISQLVKVVRKSVYGLKTFNPIFVQTFVIKCNSHLNCGQYY